MQKFATLLTTTLVLAAANAHAGLITNGSFETTTTPISLTSFENFIPGSTGISGWTVVGAAGTEVSVVGTDFTDLGISFPAEDGNNWLDLTGDGTNNDTEGVEQTVATNIGDEYTLSFYVGNVDNPATGYGVTSTVDLYINGGFVDAFSNSTTNSTKQIWEQFTTSGVADSSSTTLEFLNGDPSNDNTNGLDNVVLVDDGPAGASTPEPSSLMLLGSGLLGLTGFVRRRNA